MLLTMGNHACFSASHWYDMPSSPFLIVTSVPSSVTIVLVDVVVVVEDIFFITLLASGEEWDASDDRQLRLRLLQLLLL
jgi:hypothetical protein